MIVARVMTTDEFEHAQLLWQLLYAKQCFTHVENACLFLLDNGVHEDNPVYYPLIAAIYVLYARPFTRANVVGSLTADFVPEKLRQLHAVMMKHRNQIYAHTDPKSFDVPGHGAPYQVFVRITTEDSRKKGQLLGTEFFARPPVLEEVVKLCQELKETTDLAVGVLQEEHFPKLIAEEDGDYPINIFDPAGPFFLPKQPPLRH